VIVDEFVYRVIFSLVFALMCLYWNIVGVEQIKNALPNILLQGA